MACDLLVAPARRAHRPGLLLARLALISLFGAEFGTPAAFAAPGDLDTTFDTDGKVTTNFGFYSSRGYGLAIQADGKLLVAGRLQRGSAE